LSDYDKASCSEAQTDEEDVMPGTLYGTEKKDAAIQCDIGIRWFEFSRKTMASVGKKDV